MSLDWNVVATITSPILALFIGVWINRWYENRPVLISHFGHVSAFQHSTPEAGLLQINTHSVVLRNASRLPATNVRLHHATLPSFNVWPMVVHHIETLPDGTQDIVIPTLVRGEEITISYLYFAPLIAAQVNAGVKCDQGFATAITVLLQRQYPRWINRTIVALFIIGVVTVVYLAYLGGRAALALV